MMVLVRRHAYGIGGALISIACAGGPSSRGGIESGAGASAMPTAGASGMLSTPNGGGSTSGAAGSGLPNAAIGGNGVGISGFAGAATSGGQNGIGGDGGLSGGSSATGSAASGGSSGSSGSSGAAGTAGFGGGAAGPVGPRFIGRFNVTKPTESAFEWSGSAISLRFTGTEVSVTLTDSASNVFEVVLDGKISNFTTLSGSKKYPLASALSNGPHDLLLYRRTEPLFGDTTFNGFDLSADAYLPGPPLPKHRLEVIGDSISAGYGNEGTFPCSFVAATENQYLSYEALAARTLGAELYTEAWSGIGMLRNNGGETTNTMPQRYPRTLPAKDSTATWDFSKYIPEAVVINLGTNDFSKGDPGMAFQSTYTTFVGSLRGYYPKARFYLAVGPMLSGTNYASAKNYLNAVIAARSGAGDTNLALLEFGTQDSADGLGCDYHPSLATHQKMSLKLVAALKADLGW